MKSFNGYFSVVVPSLVHLLHFKILLFLKILKAIAVYPDKPHSMHLVDVPMPKITHIPNGQGVLVKVLRVGFDGTDKEINAAEYGKAQEM